MTQIFPSPFSSHNLSVLGEESYACDFSNPNSFPQNKSNHKSNNNNKDLQIVPSEVISLWVFFSSLNYWNSSPCDVVSSRHVTHSDIQPNPCSVHVCKTWVLLSYSRKAVHVWVCVTARSLLKEDLAISPIWVDVFRILIKKRKRKDATKSSVSGRKSGE